MSTIAMGQLLAARVTANPVGGWAVGVVLAAVFLAALALGYRRTTRPLDRRARHILWALRGLAALAVVFALFRPAWTTVGVRHERPLLVLLRDVSASMMIRDESAGGQAVTRSEAVGRRLAEHRELLAELAAKFNLGCYGFADRLERLGDEPAEETAGVDRRVVARRTVEVLEAPLDAVGRSTQLGDALGEIHETTLNRRIVGVVVLGDGAVNQSRLSAAEAARLLGKRHAPVYTVGFGSPVPTGAVRDSIARSVDAKATVFTGNRIDVTGEFRFHGLKGREVEVRLLDDGRAAGRERVRVSENRYDHRVRIPYRATAVGSHKLELVAEPVEGEAVPENNRIWTFVDVVEGGVKLLVVQGSPTVEGRFIFNALRRAGEFDCDRLVLLSAEEAAANVPATAEAWAAYKAVIFINVARPLLTSQQLSALAQAVSDRGVGFMMTGGEQAFGPGGYAGTDVERMLPVRIASADGFIEVPVRFRPTAAGMRERVLQIESAPGDVDGAWQSLPELPWANRVGGLKPAAEALAVGPDDAVLLAVEQYGSGNVAALTVGATWRWQLGGREDPPGRYFRRFWRQMALWLSGQDSGRGNVWVTTNTPRYSLPDLLSGRRRVQVTAGVSDRQGNPVTDATCTLTLSGPGGDSRKVPLRLRGDTYVASLDVSAAGDYRVQLAAHRGGTKAGEAGTRFVVYEPNVEWEEPLADPEALEEVSRLSGGTYVRADRIADVLKALLASEVSDTVTFHRRVSLWDNRLLLAVFAGLLAAEWALRKHWGLV